MMSMRSSTSQDLRLASTKGAARPYTGAHVARHQITRRQLHVRAVLSAPSSQDAAPQQKEVRGKCSESRPFARFYFCWLHHGFIL